MAKRNKAEEESREVPGEGAFFPDSHNFKEVHKDTLFHNFEKENTLFCRFIKKEKLEYEVFLVKNLVTGRECYLPSHSSIAESVEENGMDKTYKIVFNGVTKFDGGKKTFHSYDIYVSEK